MPTAVIMPKFEMAQETGTVGTWLKAEGDAVRKGEPILEIETDKVSLEVESPADGTLAGISAQSGAVIPIGQTIAFILRAGETLAVQKGQPTPQAAEPRTAVVVQPTLAATPLAARMAGELGIDLASVTGTGPRGQVTREDIEAHLKDAAAAARGAAGVRAAPAARRLARELAVDLGAIHGTGPRGRIQSEDVRAHHARVAEPPTAPSATAGAPTIRRMVALTSLRRTIADRMTASVREAPQFNVAVEADMTRALAIVEDLKGKSGASDQPKVTLTAVLIKACAWALTQHPEANSAYMDEQIAEWDEVNIGVATAIEGGLIVPVLRGADRLGVRGIAAQLTDLTARARAGKLKLEDLQGGTFTLSNLGMFGIDHFTAILNPPQAAILAVGRVARRAVVAEDGSMVVRPTTTLTLTADHRVLDGVSAARFLGTIQAALEHPGLLLQ